MEKRKSNYLKFIAVVAALLIAGAYIQHRARATSTQTNQTTNRTNQHAVMPGSKSMVVEFQ